MKEQRNWRIGFLSVGAKYALVQAPSWKRVIKQEKILLFFTMRYFFIFVLFLKIVRYCNKVRMLSKKGRLKEAMAAALKKVRLIEELEDELVQQVTMPMT